MVWLIPVQMNYGPSYESTHTEVKGPNGKTTWVSNSKYFGPSATTVGEVGAIVENQYGRWVYSYNGIWEQTAYGSANAGDISNAVLGLAGGICEMILGGASEYFSGGLSTSVSIPLVADGLVRVTANGARLIVYTAGNNNLGNAIPSNTGAILGKSIDMAGGASFYSYGFGQAFGGGTNDFLSFIYSGGTAPSLLELSKNPAALNFINYSTSHVGYLNGLFFDFYPLKH